METLIIGCDNAAVDMKTLSCAIDASGYVEVGVDTPENPTNYRPSPSSCATGARERLCQPRILICGLASPWRSAPTSAGASALVCHDVTPGKALGAQQQLQRL
jgi:hypothetical protein